MAAWEFVVLAALPVVGLVVLWTALNRWGKKHDPMKPSDFGHLVPGAADRDRSSSDD